MHLASRWRSWRAQVRSGGSGGPLGAQEGGELCKVSLEAATPAGNIGGERVLQGKSSGSGGHMVQGGRVPPHQVRTV